MKAAPLMLLFLASPAAAHALFGPALAERAPALLGALLLGGAWGLYVVGAHRRPPSPARAGCCHAAAALAVLAVFGPLDDWAQTSTSMHMLQHMLFMVAIAPLAALGQPLPQWQAATGIAMRPLWRALAYSSRQPLAAALLHGVAIWIWHSPRLYRLALEHPAWHMAEHAAFLLTAWLFWWSALHAAPRRRPQALLAVVLTLMHTGLLGALLAFGRTPFYGADRGGLADQQLAGLLMWVPGGFVYLAGALAIAWRWLDQATPPAQPEMTTRRLQCEK